ncbi:MAG: hypothetical protein ACI4MF_03260 [Candidatus Faecivicinus sp.]
MSKRLLNPLAMFCVGLILGAAARLLDLYTQNLGEIFSQMAVWILLGTLISVLSRTGKIAMLNVLTFCLGMLLTYYAAAALSHGVYAKDMMIGWTVFALCSPVMAYFAWLTKEEGVFPKIVRVGIVAVSVISSVLLFDRLRIYDLIIDGALVYVLFFLRVNR